MIGEPSWTTSAAGAAVRPLAGGALWPVGRPALAALIDMGMSDETIARYFGVEAREVQSLRRAYGIARIAED